LVVAFNYGARQEITIALQKLAEDISAGTLNAKDLTPELVSKTLDTAGLPDPDLLIRTGGEERLSNFLLWQCAYTEFVFVPEYWPDFDSTILQRAIETFQSRERRFGGLKAQRA
jgi:undecaprenyl diphosphate synthase